MTWPVVALIASALAFVGWLVHVYDRSQGRTQRTLTEEVRAECGAQLSEAQRIAEEARRELERLRFQRDAAAGARKIA